MTSPPRPLSLLRRVLAGTPLSGSRRAQRAVHRVLRALGRPPLAVWYHPAYRLPVPGLEGGTGSEPRRADFVAWYLVESGLLGIEDLREPDRASYRDIGRVHTPELLDSLWDARTLARVFATTPSDLVVDEVLKSLRLACGGTIAAAREALASGRPTLNLFGGFHHAEPSRAGGFCAINDVAIAVSVLRSEGFTGRIAVIDLDAHPPDGTAACLEGDPEVWIGSISGATWEAIRGVDETVLPRGSGDDVYLRTLSALLGRMPRVDLAFVLAGGDVLAGDRLGWLGLSLDGARERDERVAAALSGIGSVWLPAGGYHESSWRVLATTALVLSNSPMPGVPGRYDPLSRRFAEIARTLGREQLGDAMDDISFDDIAEALRIKSPRRQLMLGYYTSDGLELSLDRYGVLDHLRRLGYDDFRIALDTGHPGDRMRLWGKSGKKEHLLMEVSLEKRVVAGRDVLYVHWLTLRHPRSRFDDRRPRLPGQEVPGLGMAREASEMLVRMARRLHLAGVAFSPSHYHMAYAARHDGRFVEATREGEFQALVRDLAGMSLLDATRAVAEGRVRKNGEPYTWEATDMVAWLDRAKEEDDVIAAVMDATTFSVAPRSAAPPA